MSDLGQQGVVRHHLDTIAAVRSGLAVRGSFATGKAFCARRQRGYCVVASQTQRASYYASREKDTPLNMKTKLF